MQKINYDRQNIASDMTAGTASAFVTIPDAMASAILAGVNPMQGLSVTLLHIYGSLYFAAASTLEEILPDVKEAQRSKVCF